jgi:hypothetical protein
VLELLTNGTDKNRAHTVPLQLLGCRRTASEAVRKTPKCNMSLTDLRPGCVGYNTLIWPFLDTW